jgi:hypothetical protein
MKMVLISFLPHKTKMKCDIRKRYYEKNKDKISILKKVYWYRKKLKEAEEELKEFNRRGK